MLTACAILVDVLAVSIGVLIGVGAWQRNRWPEPTPRPYACVACGVEYSDPRALAWHLGAMHVDSYDASGWQPPRAMPSAQADASTAAAHAAVGVRPC